MSISVVIPSDVGFSQLGLELDRDGDLHFQSAPLARICEANGLDANEVLAHDQESRDLIARWYVVHRQCGGEIDKAAESMLWRLAVSLMQLGRGH